MAAGDKATAVRRERRIAALIRTLRDAEKDQFSIEYPCHFADKKCWYRLMATPLATSHDSGVVLMLGDVTDRREAEERLKDSEERFHLMVGGSEKVLFCTQDRDGRYQYLSPSVLDVLGYTPGELEGNHRDSLIIEGDAINADVQVIASKVLGGGVLSGSRDAPQHLRSYP